LRRSRDGQLRALRISRRRRARRTEGVARTLTATRPPERRRDSNIPLRTLRFARLLSAVRQHTRDLLEPMGGAELLASGLGARGPRYGRKDSKLHLAGLRGNEQQKDEARAPS